MLFNEFGVLEDHNVQDNINGVHAVIMRFFKDHKFTPIELMVFQRYYTMEITGTFSDLILGKQFQMKKEIQNGTRDYR